MAKETVLLERCALRRGVGRLWETGLRVAALAVIIVMYVQPTGGAAPPASGAASIGAPSIRPTTVPATGLVAHYPFDGSAQEAGGSGRDGRVIGATLTKDRFGREGRAYAFDGMDDEIVVAPPPGLSDKAMSVSVWVRFDFPQKAKFWSDVTDGNAPLHDPVVGQDDGYSIRSWQLCLVGKEGTILWHRLGEYSSAWSKTPAEAGRWYHLAAVWDGAEHHLYVDGVEVHKAKGIFKASRDEPLRIGAKGDANTKRAFFAGAIDDLRLYNVALTVEAVKSLFEEQAAER